MSTHSSYPTRVSLAIALGGFLMGFDSAVISGVVDPVRSVFALSADEVGWAVACLTLGATLAMAVAGPLADKFGRRPILALTAALFTVSAIGSALAPSYHFLVIARIIGGFGVGGALLIAPIYIAEIAPPERRGQLVSFNQLNIVLGFSAAFFSNYFLDMAGMSWRWMLGVEAIPAGVYLLLLLVVPPSPRWLASRGRDTEAREVLARINGPDAADQALRTVKMGIAADAARTKARISEIFSRRMRYVMAIGLGLGFFQQITGINAIFYYSTTIFGMTGVTRDVALGHAILVGVVNVVFTLVALRMIDRVGRKPLLMIGTAAMAIALLANGVAFSNATYTLNQDTSQVLSGALKPETVAGLQGLADQTFDDQLQFTDAVRAEVSTFGEAELAAFTASADEVAKSALEINGHLVLIAIMAYIAAFAISLGPVMWAMFSEIFPQRMRGLAISVAGFFNSAVSFGVQQLFPRGLETLGPAMVFFFFAGMAALAFLFSVFVVPETKGRSLEELEQALLRP